MKPLLAVVVGHTWRSPGAKAPSLGVHEHEFNCELAAEILAHGKGRVGVFYRDGHGVPGAYAAARAWGLRPGVSFGVVELHFNSALSAAATGTETIYRTPQSEGLARAAQRSMTAVLQLRDRGVKLPYEGRGEASLTALPGVPSVIVEPFFGSNAADCAVALGRRSTLAWALADAALNWLSERG